MKQDYKRLEHEDFSEYINRIGDHITALESLSEGHKIWFTHKNPYGCWICDSLMLLRIIIDEIWAEEQEFLNKLSPQASSTIKDEIINDIQESSSDEEPDD